MFATTLTKISLEDAYSSEAYQSSNLLACMQVNNKLTWYQSNNYRKSAAFLTRKPRSAKIYCHCHHHNIYENTIKYVKSTSEELYCTKLLSQKRVFLDLHSCTVLNSVEIKSKLMALKENTCACLQG